MIARHHFITHENEHDDYCTCYEDESGDYRMIVYDGEATYLETPDDKGSIPRNSDGTELEEFAKKVNPFYDDYHGYSDLHIAREVMHPIGCAHCPMFCECDAMGEEMEGVAVKGWYIEYLFEGFIHDWEKLNDLISFASGDPEDFFESEESFRQAVKDGTVRYDFGYTEIWTDGLHE